MHCLLAVEMNCVATRKLLFDSPIRTWVTRIAAVTLCLCQTSAEYAVLSFSKTPSFIMADTNDNQNENEQQMIDKVRKILQIVVGYHVCKDVWKPTIGKILKAHSTLRTLHPESNILETKLFFTNLAFIDFG